MLPLRSLGTVREVFSRDNVGQGLQRCNFLRDLMETIPLPVDQKIMSEDSSFILTRCLFFSFFHSGSTNLTTLDSRVW